MFNTLFADEKQFVISFVSRVAHTGETSHAQTAYLNGVDPAAYMMLRMLQTSNTVFTLLHVQEISRELFEVAEANHTRARGYDVVCHRDYDGIEDHDCCTGKPTADTGWHGSLS